MTDLPAAGATAPIETLATVGSILRTCIMACEGIEDISADKEVANSVCSMRYVLEHADQMLTEAMIATERMEARP